jgi:hypothetical protein
VAFAVALALASTATAHAPVGPTRARLIATLPDGTVTTDGIHYAIVQLPGRLRVSNTETRRSYEIATPCRALSGSHGRFLISCLQPDYSHSYSILDAARRTFRPISRLRPFDELDTIGRVWVAGFTTRPAPDAPGASRNWGLFIDWRTGKRREVSTRGGCYAFLNIDTPDLREPVPRLIPCASYRYDGSVNLSVAPPRFRLVFTTASRQKVLLDQDCLSRCQSWFLGGGHVTWVEQRPGGQVVVGGYSSVTNRRASWSLGTLSTPCDLVRGCLADATHTRDTIFVRVIASVKWVCSENSGHCDNTPTAWRLYSMPWPGGSRH